MKLLIYTPLILWGIAIICAVVWVFIGEPGCNGTPTWYPLLVVLLTPAMIAAVLLFYVAWGLHLLGLMNDPMHGKPNAEMRDRRGKEPER